MGWEDRDYARGSGYSSYAGNSGYSGGGGMFSGITPACKAIIVANVIVFVSQLIFLREMTPKEYVDRFVVEEHREAAEKLLEQGIEREDYPKLFGRRFLPQMSIVQEFCSIDTQKIMRGQVWRLVTGGFCHDPTNIMHILFNMLFLFWFGTAVERIYGKREFACFYFAGLIASSCAYVGLDLWVKDYIPAIGASGAVMAVTMLCAIHYPKTKLLLFFIIPIEIRWFVILYCIWDLYPVIQKLSGAQVETGVAHMGHLGGLAFGFLYWKFQLQLERWLPRSGTTASNRRVPPREKRRDSGSPVILKLRLLDDDPNDLLDEFDRKIDEILRKIKKEGEASLSEKERNLLEAASRKYRDRD